LRAGNTLAGGAVTLAPGPPAARTVRVAGIRTSPFSASPRVVTDEQAGGGHNLSLGLSAMAYHLKVLAFADECALARSTPGG